MLERLVLWNFQCHERLTIDFDENITTIVGRSDCGKTAAAVRAPRWICLNQPSGTAFLRNGSEYVRGVLYVDGRKVKRERVGGDNSYWLDGHKYQAFGTGVPDEIAAILNVSDMNFQRQLDAPYLLSQSPGEVARNLNSIVSLDSIDRALSWVASEMRKAKAAITVSETRLANARGAKEVLSWVKEANVALQELEALEGQIKAIEREEEELSALLEELREAERLADVQVPDFSGVEELKERLDAIMKEERELLALLEELREAEARLEEATERAKEAAEELAKASEGKCPVCGSEMR